MSDSLVTRSAVLALSAALASSTLAACSSTDDRSELPSTTESSTQTHHFDYDETSTHGPAKWGDMPGWELCRTGSQQSPINVPSRDTFALDERVTLDWNPGALSAVNNSHTVNVRPDGDNTVTYDGRTFELSQFHLHSDSEHEVDGRSTPLEAHFVHALVGEDGAPVMTTDAPTQTEVPAELLVIGVMLDEGEAHEFWGRVLRDGVLPTDAADDYEVVDEAALDPTTLLPADLSTHAYTGSLTTPTPTCLEGVNWFVLTTPVQVSAEQIATFTALYPNNSRPVQLRD